MAKTLCYGFDRRLVDSGRRRRGREPLDSRARGIASRLGKTDLERLVPWITQACRIHTRLFQQRDEFAFRSRVSVRTDEACRQRSAYRLVYAEEPVPLKVENRDVI